jgi:hypothetical protein
MFEEDDNVVPVPLSQISLMSSKKAKSNRNHRAELFIWIGAHEWTDFPRHPPLWLNKDNEVEEGSSTFVSIVHNFLSMEVGSTICLTIPCIYRIPADAPLTQEEIERSCLVAAWMGISDDVKWALGDLGATGIAVVEQYGISAIAKAKMMGYSDIVEIIESHQL